MTLYHWSFSIFKISGQKEKPLFHLFPMATIRNFHGSGKFVVHLTPFNKNGVLLPDDLGSNDVGLFVESIFDRKHGVDISTNHCNKTTTSDKKIKPINEEITSYQLCNTIQNSCSQFNSFRRPRQFFLTPKYKQVKVFDIMPGNLI